MNANVSPSQVMVYSTPNSFDADLVKAMLADENIPSAVENENSPFPGISASPCQVFVAVEHEQFARQLVEEHEARHRERLARDEKSEA